MRLVTLRLEKPATRSSRRVRVRVMCAERCDLRLRIRPKSGGRAIASRSTVLVGQRARTVTVVVAKRDGRRWRTARAGRYVVEALAHRKGLQRTTRTLALRPSR